MSKFAILKSGKVSLYKLGLIKRSIHVLVAYGLPVLAISFSFLRDIPDEFFIIPFVLLVVWIVITTGLIIYSRSYKMNPEIHGELDVTLNGIKKTISGFETHFDYDRIREIKVRDHILSVFWTGHNDGVKSYLVTIVTDDLASERFVISSLSSSIPVVKFPDSLKYVEKYKKIKLGIKR
jgi:hypothetical protein